MELLTLFAKLAMLGLSSVGAFQRTPYPLPNDATMIPAVACYLADNGSTVCYDPSVCPDPTSPQFDYCVNPNFQG